MDDFNNSQSLRKRTNMNIKIVSVRLGCSKEELKRNPNICLKVNFLRRNFIKKSEERIKSSSVKVKDSLMYFKEERIVFNDIDKYNDYLEISLSLVEEKEKIFNSSQIVLKDLVFNKEKDDIWTLHSNSLINLKYHIFEELVKDVVADFDYGFLNGKIDSFLKEDDNKKFNLNPNEQKNKLNSYELFENQNNEETDKAEVLTATNNFNTPTFSKKDSLYLKTNFSPIILKDKNNNFPNLRRGQNISTLKSVKDRRISIPNSDESLRNFNINNDFFTRDPILEDINLSILNPTRSKSFVMNNFAGEIIDYDFLEATSITDVSYQTLCEGFFISGLKEQAILMDNSIKMKSQCGHHDCSLLVSYKPEVLYKFEKKINISCSIDITNLFSSLCFPTGVKICYNPNNENLIPKKTFVNLITNQKGETYYLINYFYYREINYEYFKNNYNFDPVRDYLKIITNPTYFNSKLEKELQICSNLINSSDFYIPECISIITKYPYAKQIEKCLESIFKVMNLESKYNNNCEILKDNSNNYFLNAKNEEFINLLSHLIYDVPLPPINKKLLIYIPFNIIEIPSIIMKDQMTSNFSLRILFDELSIDNIILIFNLIILEQKILVVSDDHSKLSELTQAFISVIYPLKWVNPYLPVLSEDFIQYLQSFIPFIMGIDNDLLNLALKNKYLTSDENSKIFILNCANSTVTVMKEKKERKIKSNYLCKEGVPDLPEEISSILKTELKQIQNLLLQSKNKNKLIIEKVDQTIREIFLKIMVMIFGDYHKFIKVNHEEDVIFNSENYLINRPSNNKKFYHEFTQTQIFKEFLHLENKFKNLTIQKKLEIFSPINPNLYFYNMCIRHLILINPNKGSKNKRSSSVSKDDLIDNVKNSNLNLIKVDTSYDKRKSENIIISSRCNNSFYSESLCNTELNSSKSCINNLTSENTASNTKDSFDGYLLSPYFVNDPISKFDQIKIEEIYYKKFSNENNDLKALHSRVTKKSFYSNNLNNNLECSNNNDNKTKIIRKYNIDYMTSFNNYKEYKIKNKFDNQTLYDFTKLINIELTNSKITDNLSETIQTTLNSKVFNILNKIDIPMNANSWISIKKIMALHQGRILFANKIYMYMLTEENESGYLLNETNFNDLTKIINTFLVFSEENIKELSQIIIVLKSSFYFYMYLNFYYRMPSYKRKYLYEELDIKQASILLSERLWLKWFELESDISKLINFNFTSKNDYYFIMMLKLSCVMSLLGLKQSKISSIILQGIVPNYFFKGNSVILKELEESIIKITSL